VAFVKHFSVLYGRNMLVYNIHNLVHLADDALKHGQLEGISSFPFENFVRSLLRNVRKLISLCSKSFVDGKSQ